MELTVFGLCRWEEGTRKAREGKERKEESGNERGRGMDGDGGEEDKRVLEERAGSLRNNPTLRLATIRPPEGGVAWPGPPHSGLPDPFTGPS